MPPLYFALWLILVWGLGWLGLPVARHIWNGSASLVDGGLAAGRMLLLTLWTLLAFWAGNLGLPTSFGAFLIVPVALVCAFLARSRWADLTQSVASHRRGIVLTEGAFLVTFLLFFALRAFWPDINNGEKPMDMALISACARAAYLPPPDPYAAGLRLSGYYYLGHLETALLTDAIGATPRWTYNLMCATLPALIFSTLAALCATLVASCRYGAVGAAMVLLTGTLEPLRQWFKPLPGAQARTWPLDYFETSRVIPYTINEYPWFTFSYGDLHAHYFAMPVVVLLLSLAWALLARVRRGWRSRRGVIVAVASGLTLGALCCTNTWDFPLYILLFGLCCIALPVSGVIVRSQELVGGKDTSTAKGRPRGKALESKARRGSGKVSPRAQFVEPTTPARNWLANGLLALAMPVLAVICAMPYLTRLNSAADGPRWMPQPASPSRSWLLFWALPVGAWAMALFLETKDRWLASGASLKWMTVCALFPLAVWLKLAVATGSSCFVLTVVVTGAVWSAWAGLTTADKGTSWLCRLAFCGFLALCWSEVTYAGFLGGGPYRRQDTVFKFGLQAWYLIGTAAACANLRRQANEDLSRPKRLVWRRWPLVLRGAFLMLFAVSLVADASDTYARAQGFTEFVGWDAWSHLTPSERDAASWLASHARDGDFIIEASGPDFSEFTRYADATGVPTVVGPHAHTFYWGPGRRDADAHRFWGEIDVRDADVQTFFTTPDDATRLALARKYNVRYVVCGELERREFGAANVDAIAKTLPVAFWSGAADAPDRISICQVPNH